MGEKWFTPLEETGAGGWEIILSAKREKIVRRKGSYLFFALSTAIKLWKITQAPARKENIYTARRMYGYSGPPLQHTSIQQEGIPRFEYMGIFWSPLRHSDGNLSAPMVTSKALCYEALYNPIQSYDSYPIRRLSMRAFPVFLLLHLEA